MPTELTEPAVLLDALARGQRIVVAAAPGTTVTLGGTRISVSARPIDTCSAIDPLVAAAQIDAVVATGPYAGAVLTTRDLAVVAGGRPIAHADGDLVVAATFDVGTGTVIVVGSDRIGTDEFLAVGHTAEIVAWMLTGGVLPVAEPLRRTMVGPEIDDHATPSVVTAHDRPVRPLAAPRRSGSRELGVHAGCGPRRAGSCRRRSTTRWSTSPTTAIRPARCCCGACPSASSRRRPTGPLRRRTRTGHREFVLLTVARRLGQPVGYRPEHGGELVQNILPVRGSESRQLSTSSKVELLFHTEAAFHPHRPRYLLLLCLRGDPHASTTLASIREIVRMLPLGVRRTLFEPRFRTAADESYVGTRPTQLGLALPVLSGNWDQPNLVFDADLMVGIDEEADAALRVLSSAVGSCHAAVTLEPGDLLVVDNSVAVHGRSPFTPRFDGTDRWLQRTFVVSDLAPSAGDRDGRIIATRFAG